MTKFSFTILKLAVSFCKGNLKYNDFFIKTDDRTTTVYFDQGKFYLKNLVRRLQLYPLIYD